MNELVKLVSATLRDAKEEGVVASPLAGVKGVSTGGGFRCWVGLIGVDIFPSGRYRCVYEYAFGFVERDSCAGVG